MALGQRTAGSFKKRLSQGLHPGDETESLADLAPRRRRSWTRYWLYALASGLALLAIAPRVIGYTTLRNWPLQQGLSQLNGSITSRGATLGWLIPIHYEGIELRDNAGQLVLELESVESSASLWQLALNPVDLGTFRIRQPRVNLIVRNDGSNLEDLLAHILASRQPAAPRQVRIEVTNGTVQLHDVAAQRQWQIRNLQLALTQRPDAWLPTDWTTSGEIPLADRVAKFVVGTPSSSPAPGVPALVNAADQAALSTTAQTIQIRTQQFPLEILRAAVARTLGEVEFAGLFSTELELQNRFTDQRLEQDVRGRILLENVYLAGGRLAGDQLRLNRVELPVDLTSTPEAVDFRAANLICDFGQIQAVGKLPLAALTTGDLRELSHAPLQLSGQAQLAPLAAQLPRLLQLNPQTQLTAGELSWSWNCAMGPRGKEWGAEATLANLTASYQGSPVALREPVQIVLAAHAEPAGVIVDKLMATAKFLKLNAGGNATDLQATIECDLDQLAAEFGQFINLKPYAPAGALTGDLAYKLQPDGSLAGSLNADLTNFQLTLPGQATFREPQLALRGRLAGTHEANVPRLLQTAELQLAAPAPPNAAVADQFFARITQPLDLRQLGVGASSLPSGSVDYAALAWPLEFVLQGELAAWQARLGTMFPLEGVQVAGTADLRGTGLFQASAIKLDQFQGRIQNADLRLPGARITEDQLDLTTQGEINLAARQLRLGQTNFLCATANLQATEVQLAWPQKGAITGGGKLVYGADLSRLQLWIMDRQMPPAIRWSGSLRGEALLNTSGQDVALDCRNFIEKFTLYDSAAANRLAVNGRPGATQPVVGNAGRDVTLLEPLWSEPRLNVNIRGGWNAPRRQFELELAELQSQALALQATGRVNGANADEPIVELGGKVNYDWQTLAPVLRTYLGESVQVTGRETREFTVKGPLRLAANPTDLAARGAISSTPVIADPAAGATATTPEPLALLQPLTASASVGWQSLAAYGFELNQGAIDLALSDGLVTMKPLEVQAGAGQLRIAPQVRLTPGMPELLLPRGTALENIHITPPMAQSWLKFVTPVLADATRIDGKFSLDLAGGKVPLAKPLAADISGRIRVQEFAVTPGEPAQALVLLGAQITALIEKKIPPTQVDRQVVLLKMPEQNVDFRVVDGRVYHQGMTMQVGKVVLQTQGWVNLEDESLGLLVEVPFQPDWVQKLPILAKIPEQKFQIPMEGTLRQPKVSSEAIKQITSLLLQNAAQNAIENQLNRGLDRLLRPR